MMVGVSFWLPYICQTRAAPPCSRERDAVELRAAKSNRIAIGALLVARASMALADCPAA
jgi:hypothetical protein